MEGRHTLDPLHLHHAAERLGVIVGNGEMGLEDARACCKQWARDNAAVPQHRLGLQMRLVHRMRDAAVARRRARATAEVAIGWAVRPLFAARATAAAIEEAAGRANGEVLEWDEVAAVLREELAAARGRRRA